ncbi:MAG: sugar phosphate isomerase/epimerase [Clostridia bacterium]|nr:sugar phosphate isomerase/epimerase [Clostridia bacterium]
MPVLGARAHDYRGSTPDELFASIAGDGFAAAQLAFKKSFSIPYPVPEAFLEETAKALQKHKLHLAVVGCYIDPALPDRETRRQQVDTFIAALPAAKALNAGCVGTETTNFDKAGGDRKAAMERLIDSVKRMAEAAEKQGVNIGIEPVYDHVMHNVDETLEVIDKVGSSRVHIIWDAVNLLSRETVMDQPGFFRSCYDAFKDRLIAMHLKDFVLDADGKKPDRPLFEGELNVKALLSLVKTDANIPVLREHAIPERSVRELAAIREILK